MALPYMTQSPVAVTTGQPLTPWVYAKGARVVNFILYSEDGNTGHMLIEVAAELDGNGNAVKSEIVEPDFDVQCLPGGQKTYTVRFCPYYYVRLSARGDSPGYPSTNVRGSVEVIP